MPAYAGCVSLCSTFITSMYKLLCIRNGQLTPMSYAPCSFHVAKARLNHYRAVFPSYKYSLVKIVPGCD
jgi:hypothetical protein